MSETLQSLERLSNRRLMYEAFVTAMRRVNAGHTDAHYIHGQTSDGTDFRISDYFYFESVQGRVGNLQAGREAQDHILESRRPIIDVDVARHSYVMIYPEDLHPNSDFLGSTLRGLLPPNWPPNEPFVYGISRSGDGGLPSYYVIDEPFDEPQLASIYEQLTTNL